MYRFVYDEFKRLGEVSIYIVIFVEINVDESNWLKLFYRSNLKDSELLVLANVIRFCERVGNVITGLICLILFLNN